MGDCIAGGGYMPIISDRVYMTERAYMVIAGAALIKGAKSQKLSSLDIGGADVHVHQSGCADERVPDDETAIDRIRDEMRRLPDPPQASIDKAPRPPLPSSWRVRSRAHPGRPSSGLRRDRAAGAPGRSRLVLGGVRGPRPRGGDRKSRGCRDSGSASSPIARPARRSRSARRAARRRHPLPRGDRETGRVQSRLRRRRHSHWC